LAFEAEGSSTGKDRLILTAAVAAGEWTVETAYDIPRISAALDYIHLMTYDLHGGWDGYVGHHSQFNIHPNDPNTSAGTFKAIKYWLDGGLSASKLVFGMPAYGRGFTLDNPGPDSIGTTATIGMQGPDTKEDGYMAYFEICEKINNGWTEGYSEEMKSAFAYGDGQWIGYENRQSLQHRCDYINQQNFAGVMFWDTSLDDVKGNCGQGTYPLISLFNTCLN